MPRGGLTPQATPRAAAPAPAAAPCPVAAPAPAPAPAGHVIDAPAPRFSILRGWSQPTTGIESKYAPDVWNALATPLDNPRRTRQNPTDDEIRTLVARVTGQAKIERNVTGDFRKLRRRRSLLRAAAEQREIDARLAAMLAPSPALAPAPAPAPAPVVVEAEPAFLPEAD